MNDASREAFETSEITKNANLARMPISGEFSKYVNPTVQLMWIGWQASRKQALADAAAACTAAYCENSTAYPDEYGAAILDCEAAIKGLK